MKCGQPMACLAASVGTRPVCSRTTWVIAPRASHYNPGVRRAVIEGPQRRGVGARRSCELVPKGRVVECVTHWEDGRAVGLEVTESDWPIHFMRWVTRLEPDSGGTRITQSLEYAVKFGVIGGYSMAS